MRNEKPTPNPSPSLPLSGEGERTTAPPLIRGGREGLGFIPYNKNLTTLARENRKNPTAPESIMWNKVLRMRHFAQYKFLRQKPIADFIVDFYCAELRLAIEIDGDSHAESIEYDAARTAALNAHDISVVRYINDEVMKNLEGVYDDLMSRIAQINSGIAER